MRQTAAGRPRIGPREDRIVEIDMGNETYRRLKMTRPGFVAAKSTTTNRFGLIVPVWGQKVKCIGPSAFEELIGSREEEPAGPTDRTAVAASFRHDFNTRL